jgi:hypothetical protein
MKRASAVLSYVVYRANVWVIQSGGRFCFSLEPFQRLRVVRQVFRQEFQRHRAFQPRIFGPIHHTHSAAAQPFHNAVMRYDFPG